jgi:hypothetical protein
MTGRTGRKLGPGDPGHRPAGGPGQGPASGYRWEQFTEGNLVRLEHGARSARFVDPVAGGTLKLSVCPPER